MKEREKGMERELMLPVKKSGVKLASIPQKIGVEVSKRIEKKLKMETN